MSLKLIIYAGYKKKHFRRINRNRLQSSALGHFLRENYKLVRGLDRPILCAAASHQIVGVGTPVP